MTRSDTRTALLGLSLAISLAAIAVATLAADFSPAEPGRPWLGFAVDDSLVPGRVVVVDVEPSGPAAEAGVQRQDMILAVNGAATDDADQFAAAVAAIVPGDDVRLAIGRAGNTSEVRIRAVAAAQPATKPGVESFEASPSAAVPATESSASLPPNPFPAGDRYEGSPQPAFSTPSAPSSGSTLSTTPAEPTWRGTSAEASSAPNLAAGSRRALGVRTVPVDAVVQARYSLPDTHGALVVAVVDDMPASRAGLPTGSVIVALDSRPVRSPRDLTQLVADVPPNKPVTLQYVLPGGQAREASVALVPAASGPVEEGGIDDVTAEIRSLRTALEDISRRLEAIERRRAVK